ncbi:septal ring lytic transglycosylase RlpA family protein [Noviherbaspirillum sp. L7-7A]|uniref:septal ring lytic transglycosylase RlpA family protein n=1 Tax=Noviherbaspirillum sp. L7-7A TaxID=2850560 RepID=UPI001C2BF658|nr:septal ring lytic transglycosylase RlpA family protein [Noviherbaspirillum sp. L7-7A]MBV0881251.1 septal ring lytic transglycosylase RlpA family protein [Noviherbaspirillum sp. L7-7A]
MISSRKSRQLAACLVAFCIGAAATAATAATPHGNGKAEGGHAARSKSTKTAKSPKATKANKTAKTGKPALDLSGKARRGKASYYGRKFHGRKMADGTRMNPNANVAASKTLPLGTKAEIVNLESGKKAVVEIRDRGPYVKDRIVDVTPKVADKLDMKEDGVAPVEVKPIEVPQPDGSVKQGEGASRR